MLAGNNTVFQTEVLGLLNKLKAKKEAIQREFEQRLAEVDREIDAVNITARLLREPEAVIGGQATPPVVEVMASVSELLGKNTRQALVTIARKNDGIVRVVSAKPLLLAAGIIKQRKNAWGWINTTLSRSREFEKIEPGTFRLIDSQANKSLMLQ